MQINFTKKQYRTLLSLIYLGSWMANAHRTEDRIEEFEKLKQYILSFNKDFGMDEQIEYDEKNKMYFLKDEYLESSGIERLIDEYNDNIFWEELIHGLANRDMLERYGIEALDKMNPVELLEKKSVKYFPPAIFHLIFAHLVCLFKNLEKDQYSL